MARRKKHRRSTKRNNSGQFVRRKKQTKARRRTTASTSGESTMARSSGRRRKRRNRGQFTSARKSRRGGSKRVTRRRSGGMARGFTLVDTVKQAGFATAGFIGVNMAMDVLSAKEATATAPASNGILPASLQTGYGRIGTKVGLAAAVFLLGKRFLGTKNAAALATGMLVSPGLDVYTLVRARQAAHQFVGPPQSPPANPDTMNGYGDPLTLEGDDNDTGPLQLRGIANWSDNYGMAGTEDDVLVLN